MSRWLIKVVFSMASLGVAALAGMIALLLATDRYLSFSRAPSVDDVMLSTIPLVTLLGMLLTCWLAIWRKVIDWTARRIWLTAAFAFACLAIPFGAAWMAVFGYKEAALVGAAALLLFLATAPMQLTLIWRRSEDEEGVR